MLLCALLLAGRDGIKRPPPSLLCSLDLVNEDPKQKMSRKGESESGVLVLSRIPPLRIIAG